MIEVTYRITGSDVRAAADAIRVEQTIEFPYSLAPQWIQEQVVGQITAIEKDLVTIGYPVDVAAGGFSQFLNVVWGNVSLFPGVRLVCLVVPDDLFPGPAFGVSGLRERFGAHERPLLATALKPMGLSARELAQMARTLAAAGLDLIKDDHSLSNQPWAPWRERVAACARAVREANDEHGTHGQYLPALNLPINQIPDAVEFAVEAGAGGLLVLPGLMGFDAIRTVALASGLPIMAHPSFLGSLVVSPDQGIDHGVLFGDLMRLAGADISIFPNMGGRFSFTQEECISIRDRCAQPLGSLKTIWPSPGGGMTLDRIPQMRDLYGEDVVFLIGGALHDGDLFTNAAAMVSAVCA
jgi:ribulose-bisphosphate carboxylase large chain